MNASTVKRLQLTHFPGVFTAIKRENLRGDAILPLSMKILRSLCTGYTVLSLTAVLSSLAHGATIFDNTATASGGSDPVTSPSSGGYGPLYDSFTTGAGNEVIVDLQLILSGNPSDAGSIDVGLYSDSSTTPGPEIYDFGTLGDSSLSGNPELIDISTGDPTLAPDTRYWIGLADNSASGASSAMWSYSSDTSGPGVANEFFDNSNGIFANTPNGPYQMSVTEVAATPEPKAALLMSMGASLLLLPLLFPRRTRV